MGINKAYRVGEKFKDLSKWFKINYRDLFFFFGVLGFGREIFEI